jgi:hypothetical protein
MSKFADAPTTHVSWAWISPRTAGFGWLVPAERVPEGAILLGVAAILLGVNVVRHLKHVTVSGFSLVLGLAALLAAFSRIWRTDLPGLAICLLVIGAASWPSPFWRRPHDRHSRRSP